MPARIGQRLVAGGASRVLLDGEQAGHAAVDLIFAADEVARALRGDQHDVDILAGLDLAIMDGETVGDEQGRTRLDVRGDRFGISGAVAHVGAEQSDERPPLRGLGSAITDAKPSALARFSAPPPATGADHDLMAAVAQVARMGAATGCHNR